MEYIKKEHQEISSNEEDIKSKLKEINQEAIIKAYQKMLIQNLQLFFSQVVIEYNNNNKDIDKELILKFYNLKEQNTIKSNKSILFEEYSKISKISKMMLNEEKSVLKSTFKKPEDVLKYLESEFLDEKKNIRFLNFDNIFKIERKAILNKKNGLTKLNTNIYEDKKALFTEINFEKNIINNFNFIKDNKKTITNKLNID